jgi:NADPH:quinone reductase-like Zn-dependent oxidoreductase
MVVPYSLVIIYKAWRKSVKAIVCTKYGPPEVLQLRDVEKPVPKNNEVLIKICATAVTASDCIVRGMKLSAWHPMGFMARLVMGFKKPRQSILGLVLAGDVEFVGKDVKRFSAGDQVFAFTTKSPLQPRFGAYAEYICLPDDSLLALKPSNATYEEAAAVPYGGLLALHFMKKGQIQSGQKVLIYGASGAVGTAAVQLAKHFGATVTGVCSTRNLELVNALGADTVIDYTQEDFTTRGERYDFIFNGVGKTKAQLQCENALMPNGKHITVDDGTPIFHLEELDLLRELVETGVFKAAIDRCYLLDQMVEAHTYVEKGHKKGNVVITV